MKNRIRRSTMIIGIIILIITMMIPSSVFAAGKIDPEAPCSLKIGFLDAEAEGGVIPGCEFTVYRIASVDEFARLTLTEDFSDCPIAIKDLDIDGWQDMIITLKSMIVDRSIEASAPAAVTGEDGYTQLNELSTGLYLVTGKAVSFKGYTYTPKDFVIQLPEADPEENAWNYEAGALVKFEKAAIPPVPVDDPTGKTVSRKALKIWNDEGLEEQRPASIQVKLYGNGELADTVTLSEENDWRFTWDNLDAKTEWIVAEGDAEGYTVVVGQEGITFTITNSPEEDIPEDPTPLDPGEPGEPGEPEEFEEMPEDPVPLATLPQTGVLWWPVILCGALGSFLTLIGLYMNKSGRKEY